MAKCKTLAIPIRVTDYSNSSQVASLFTRDAGLVEVIAKGAYRPKSAFQGPLDLAVLREVVYLERHGPGLATLAESEVRDGYRGLRASWRRHLAACHVLEFLRAVATGGEPARDLFDLAAKTFTELERGPVEALSRRLLHFEVRALRVLGFLGAIDECVTCGRRWPARRAAYFSPLSGGLLCRECRGSRAERGVRSTALSGDVVMALQSLVESSRMEEENPLEGTVVRDLHRLMLESLTCFLERPFRMAKYSAAWS